MTELNGIGSILNLGTDRFVDKIEQNSSENAVHIYFEYAGLWY